MTQQSNTSELSIEETVRRLNLHAENKRIIDEGGVTGYHNKSDVPAVIEYRTVYIILSDDVVLEFSYKNEVLWERAVEHAQLEYDVPA